MSELHIPRYLALFEFLDKPVKMHEIKRNYDCTTIRSLLIVIKMTKYPKFKASRYFLVKNGQKTRTDDPF